MKNRAFTLAEVLITLGIIGVVAAMTIPTLMNNIMIVETKTKLKKTVSTMSLAAKLTREKYGFDFSYLDSSYQDPVGGSCTDNPSKTRTFCSFMNASVSNATYLGSGGSLYNIKSVVTPKIVPYGNGFSRRQAYMLLGGIIIAINMDTNPKDCVLGVGEVLDKDWIVNHKACVGYIDVNGKQPPNTEIACSDSTTEFNPNEPCYVKRGQVTDVYPIIFHDDTISPATNAAAYVMKN